MANRWVLLLRGVNVGGHNRLSKEAFRDAVEAAGGRDVVTYIQSGNAVFSTDGPLNGVEVRAALKDVAGVDVPVCLMTASAFKNAMQAVPFPTDNDKAVHLLFAYDAVTPEMHTALDMASKGNDAWAAEGATIYVHTPDGFGRSKLAEAASRKLPATARNWRTVGKIADLI